MADPTVANLAQTLSPEGVGGGKVAIMFAALISLFVDQSFGAVYQALQVYAGGSLGASADEQGFQRQQVDAARWGSLMKYRGLGPGRR